MNMQNCRKSLIALVFRKRKFEARFFSQIKSIEQNHLNAFSQILTEKKSKIIADYPTLRALNCDWTDRWRGESQLCLQPSSTAELSELLAYCNRNNLRIVPIAGNTSLVGGCIAAADEILLSTATLKDSFDFCAQSGVLKCGAGFILQEINDKLKSQNTMLPYDLGAKGSCQIGGNVATNAGGLRLLRYGSMHANVLGMEVVLADGSILDMMKACKKDNTGFDLKHLFIGSEGTLGVISQVAIQTVPLPNAINLAIFSVGSFEEAKNIFYKAKKHLAEILSACEVWDAACHSIICQHLAKVDFMPHSCEDAKYVLIETHGSCNEHDSAKLMEFVQNLTSEIPSSVGIMAQDASQIEEMWKFREDIPEACSKMGTVLKYDVTLDLQNFYEIVSTLKQRFMQDLYLAKSVYVLGYGHLGDGNLHLNIVIKDRSMMQRAKNITEPFIWEFISKANGSISAEHGIGLMKRGLLHWNKTQPVIDQMKAIKSLLDPKCILNANKLF